LRYFKNDYCDAYVAEEQELTGGKGGGKGVDKDGQKKDGKKSDKKDGKKSDKKDGKKSKNIKSKDDSDSHPRAQINALFSGFITFVGDHFAETQCDLRLARDLVLSKNWDRYVPWGWGILKFLMIQMTQIIIEIEIACITRCIATFWMWVQYELRIISLIWNFKVQYFLRQVRIGLRFRIGPTYIIKRARKRI
jgi:hypothetical protein